MVPFHLCFPFLAYFMFASLMIALRITGKDNSSQVMSKYHLYSIPIYFVLAGVLGDFSFDILFGLFVYIWLHYCIFLVGFGVFRRSFTLNLLYSFREANREIGTNEIFNFFGEGAGIEVVKNVRIEAMKRNHLIEVKEDRVKILPLGIVLVRIRNILKTFLRIDYIVHDAT